jgi:hypothetical protein
MPKHWRRVNIDLSFRRFRLFNKNQRPYASIKIVKISANAYPKADASLPGLIFA